MGGRAARAGVRVGLFVCVCLCRERPPCEGFFLSVTIEVSEVKNGVSECAACFLWRHGRGSVHSGFPKSSRRKVRNPKKGCPHTHLRSAQPTGGLAWLSAVRTKLRSFSLSSDLFGSFATTNPA